MFGLVATLILVMTRVLILLVTTPFGMVILLICAPIMVYQVIEDSRTLSDAQVPQYLHVVRLMNQDHVARNFHRYVMTVQIKNTSPDMSSPADLWVACRTHGVAHDDDGPLGIYENLVAFNARYIDTVKGSAPQIIAPNTTMNVEFDQESGPFQVRTSETILDDCKLGATSRQALAFFGYGDDTDHRTRMLSVTPRGEQQYGFKPGWRD